VLFFSIEKRESTRKACALIAESGRGRGRLKQNKATAKSVGLCPVRCAYSKKACTVAVPFAIKSLLTGIRISIWTMEDRAFA